MQLTVPRSKWRFVAELLPTLQGFQLPTVRLAYEPPCDPHQDPVGELRMNL
jgi:hypothetical protein